MAQSEENSHSCQGCIIHRTKNSELLYSLFFDGWNNDVNRIALDELLHDRSTRVSQEFSTLYPGQTWTVRSIVRHYRYHVYVPSHILWFTN